MNQSQTDVIGAVIESTQEVFETVVFMDLRPGTIIDDTAVVEGVDLSAYVCLAGEFSGLLAVHCARALAREICQTIACGEEGHISLPQMRDAVGEMANMIAGNLKRRISDGTNLFEIAVPSVIEGNSLKICHAGAKTTFPRILVPFSANEQHEFFVELHYKIC